MFKRLGVLGLMLAAATISLVHPAQAFGQNRYDRGNSYSEYSRSDHGNFRPDRDYGRDGRERYWRGHEARERVWQEHEWRERQRWNRGRYSNNYRSQYYNPYYSRPY